jgi:hypothetical protein
MIIKRGRRKLPVDIDSTLLIVLEVEWQRTPPTYSPVDEIFVLSWIVVCQRNNNARVVVCIFQLSKIFSLPESTLEIFIVDLNS